MPAPTLGGFWPHWLWPGDPRPPKEIDDEVAEELRLHLDLMAEEAERRGASPDAARAEAAERFGDFDHLVRRCRREKQGDAPMLRRVQTVLVLLLLAAVGAVAWQQLEMRNQIVASQNNINQQFNALRRTLSGITPVAIADNAWSSGVVWADQSKPTRFGTVTRQAAGAYSAPTYSAPAPTEPLEPVRGWGQNERASTGWAPEGPSAPTYAADYARTVSRLIAVQDPSGRPIGGARIQVVASARSPNDTIASGVTDSEGHWKLHAGLQRGAVGDLWVYAAGRPFVRFDLSSAPRETDIHRLVMPEPTAVDVLITREDGEPASRYSVTAVSRTDLHDRTHGPPSDLGRELWRQTDESGRLTIDWLAPGDIATIRVKARGAAERDAIEVRFDVPEDASEPVAIDLAKWGGPGRGTRRGQGRGGFGGEFGEGVVRGGGFGGGFGEGFVGGREFGGTPSEGVRDGRAPRPGRTDRDAATTNPAPSEPPEVEAETETGAAEGFGEGVK